ncbi:MAG: TrkA C-terminal domain-containing protein [Nitriliruptorales bacterium]|nr:TrkA C-terminal domain-containing protein [Nitriliruptorales bacterium]
MVGVVAVLVLVTLSLVVTRVGATAFEATGVSRDLAHFQARSAFTGVGYTTSEAETIASDPARRRIVLTLMLLGNAGIVSVIASLVIGLGDAPTSQLVARVGVLLAGLGILWIVSSTPAFNQLVKRWIQRALERWTELEVRDYVQLLDVSGDYAVRDIRVDEGDWLAGDRLSDLNLTAEGVLVLAVRRGNGEFLGAPGAETTIRAGDTVLLYGRDTSLDELVDRAEGPSGDAEHDQGVERQEHVQAAEKARDEQAEADERARQARDAGREQAARRAEARAREAGRRAERSEQRADAVDDEG